MGNQHSLELEHPLLFTHKCDNDNRVRILRIIDKFRELGVSEVISLPWVGAPATFFLSADDRSS